MSFYTYHHDNLQSVLGLTGHDGTVLQTMAYDPFGNQVVTTGNPTNNTLTYTGRKLDPLTAFLTVGQRSLNRGLRTWHTENTYESVIRSGGSYGSNVPGLMTCTR